MVVARGIMVWFGCVSFVLVFIKEELYWIFQSKLAQAQYRRRFILLGKEETARMRTELKTKSLGSIEILAELNLNQTPVQVLVEMLHQHSVNGVILSSKHATLNKSKPSSGPVNWKGSRLGL